MACVEGFFIYNAKGDPIIYRVYRDNLSLRVVSDIFRTRVLHYQASQSAPVCQSGSLTLAHIACQDVFLVAVVKNNANVVMALKWLDLLVQLFSHYFHKVKEKHIRENFVLIYELLDEVCDYGIPQITDPFTLKAYIFQKGEYQTDKHDPGGNVTLQVTGAVAHRNPTTVYKKNEVYLDIVETINVLMSKDGSVLRADVEGRVLMKAFLSGMPECCLGFNMAGEDCTFSTIVRQSDWESRKSISFVPPDNGNKSEFEIMRYRISDQVSVPFKVIPNIVESGRTRCSVDVVIKSLFERSLSANSVQINIPVPPQTAKVNIKKSKGDAKYDGSLGVIRWNISKFSGQKQHTLSADVVLVSTTREKKTWNRPPVSITFNVPMFSASQLRVLYLKIQEKSGYAVEKWVRKVCKAGGFHCRIK
eukprot:jgi/Ulvmu1/4188/UM019_0167.1